MTVLYAHTYGRELHVPGAHWWSLGGSVNQSSIWNHSRIWANYVCHRISLVGGFNHLEKCESQLGWLFPYTMESHKIHVPNHQPGILVCPKSLLLCIYGYILIRIWSSQGKHHPQHWPNSVLPALWMAPLAPFANIYLLSWSGWNWHHLEGCPCDQQSCGMKRTVERKEKMLPSGKRRQSLQAVSIFDLPWAKIWMFQPG